MTRLEWRLQALRDALGPSPALPCPVGCGWTRTARAARGGMACRGSDPSGASVSHSIERAAETGSSTSRGGFRTDGGEQEEQLWPRTNRRHRLPLPSLPTRGWGCCAPHARSRDPWVMGRGSRRGCTWVFREGPTASRALCCPGPSPRTSGSWAAPPPRMPADRVSA